MLIKLKKFSKHHYSLKRKTDIKDFAEKTLTTLGKIFYLVFLKGQFIGSLLLKIFLSNVAAFNDDSIPFCNRMQTANVLHDLEIPA